MEVVISGYGKMGRMIEQVLKEKGINCAAISEDIKTIDADVAARSVCIDFTTPAAIRANYKFLADHFKAVVIGTTGWSDMRDEVLDYFRKTGTTLIYASNFSIGVNLMFAATRLLADKLGVTGGYAPYIIEMHHCHKLDAPSGTAKTLAEIVDSGMHTHTDISAVRCGEIPGTHTVGFVGTDDKITLTHEAYSRMGFAQGAVAAAIKADEIKGVYEFQELLA